MALSAIRFPGIVVVVAFQATFAVMFALIPPVFVVFKFHDIPPQIGVTFTTFMAFKNGLMSGDLLAGSICTVT